ncbi:hypothetical protein HMPREF3091_12430 [Hafnia sp. HMSC23F03]|nr:hypothetical protein HMPREF3091_12430 [Hafnia sp. HMSC23F03]
MLTQSVSLTLLLLCSSVALLLKLPIFSGAFFYAIFSSATVKKRLGKREADPVALGKLHTDESLKIDNDWLNKQKLEYF